MSDDAKSEQAPWLDPMKAWRDWFVQNERQWSEALTQMMKGDDVARAVGERINAALYSQKMFTEGMAAPAALFNMPTRADITALGERMGRLEDAVARIEAALVQLRNSIAGAADKPPRTRREASGDDITPAA